MKKSLPVQFFVILFIGLFFGMSSSGQLVKGLANEITFTSGKDKQISLVGCGDLGLSPCYEATVLDSANALVDDNSFATLLASPGLLADLASYEGIIELKFPSVLLANTPVFIRLNGDVDLFASLLGGDLGTTRGEVLDVLLLGRQEIVVQARNEETIVLERSSFDEGGFGTDPARLVTDVSGNYYLIIRPDQDYDRVRLINAALALVGLESEYVLDVYNAFGFSGEQPCGQPQFTSFDADGINSGLLGGGTSGVENPENAIDGDINSFSALEPGILNEGGTISQFFEFGTLSSIPSDEIQVTLSGSPAVLDAGFLGSVRLIAYDGVNEVYNNSIENISAELVDVLQLDLLNLLTEGDTVSFPVHPGVSFDRFEVRVGALPDLDVSEAVRIHNIVKTPGRPTFAHPEDNNVLACPNDVVTLSVLGQPGDIVSWYGQRIGGEVLFTGNDYIIGDVGSLAVFYAGITRAGCSEASVRVPVTVDVSKYPVVSAGGPLSYSPAPGSNFVLPVVLATAEDGSVVPVNYSGLDGAPLSGATLAGPFQSEGRYIYEASATADGCSNSVYIVANVLNPEECPAVYTPHLTDGGQEFSTSSLLGIALGSVANPNQAVDDNLSSFSVLEETIGGSILGITGETSQTLKWTQPVAAGTPVTIKLGKEFGAVPQITAGIYVQAILADEPTGQEVIADGNMVSVLNGLNEVSFTFVPTNDEGVPVSYDAVKVGLLPVVNTTQKVRVYGAYYFETSASAPACDFEVWDTQTGFESGTAGQSVASGSVAVNNPGNAADGDLNTFAAINNITGSEVSSKLDLFYPIPALVGDSLRIKIGVSSGTVDPSQLQGYQIQRFLGNQATGDPVDLSSGSFVFSALSGNTAGFLSLAANVPFDRVKITSGGLSGSLEQLLIFEVEIVAHNNIPGEYFDDTEGIWKLDICAGEILELLFDSCDGVKFYSSADGSTEVTLTDISELPAGDIQTIFVQSIRFGCESTSTRRPLTIQVGESLKPVIFPAGIQVVALGDSIELSVSNAVDYPASVTFQWFFEGEEMAGEVGPTLWVKNFSNDKAGSYSVVAFSPCTSEISEAVVLEVVDIDFWKSFILDSGESQVSGGEIITYTLHVRNNGGTELTDLIIVDTVPENTVYVPNSADGSGGTLVGSTIVWNMVSVQAGGVAEKQFQVEVGNNLSGIDFIANTALLKNNVDDPGIKSYPPNVNNDGPDETAGPGTFIPVENVESVISWKSYTVNGNANVDSVSGGETIHYTIFIKNTGNQNLTNVLVTDEIPQKTTYLSGGTLNGSTVEFSIVSIDVGQTVSVSFQVSVDSDLSGLETIRNVALVKTNPGDSGDESYPPVDNTNPEISGPDITGNRGTDIFVEQITDFSISKIVTSSSEGSTQVGDTLTYEIVVKNIGNQSINLLTITDPVPGYTIFLDAENNGVLNEDVVQFAVNDLAVDSSKALTFRVTVDVFPANVNQITNIATGLVGFTGPGGQPVQLEKSTPPVNITIDCRNATAEDITGVNGEICAGDTFDLRAAVSSEVLNPVFKFYTDSNLDPLGRLTDTIVTPLTTTMYYVTVEGDGVCQNLPGQAFELIVTVIPTAQDSDIQISNIEICEGEAVVLTPVSTTVTNPVFRWFRYPDMTEEILDGQQNGEIIFDLGFDGVLAINGLSNGTFRFYVSVLGDNKCENIPGFLRQVEVIVMEKLPAPVVPQGVQTFCISNNPTLTDLQVVGQNIRFYNLSYGGEELPLSTPLVNGTTYYASQTSDFGCESETRAAIQVAVVNCIATLEIGKTAGNTVILAGNNLTYTITVKNTGVIPATSVSVSDELSGSVNFVSANNGGANKGGIVSWNVGTIDPGASKNLTLVVNVPGNTKAGTVIRNTAVVESPDDPGGPKESAPVYVTVENDARAVLMVEKVADTDTVTAGEDLTYTISVNNMGTAEATSVSVTDELPPNVVFVSANNGGAFNAGVVSWNFNSIEPGSSQTITLVVNIPKSVVQGTLIRNTVVANSPDDPDGPKESAPEEVVVEDGLTVVAVTKTANTNHVYTGATVSFSITIANQGDDPAKNIHVVDELPVGLAAVSAGNGGSIAGNTITWDIEEIGPGQELTLTLTTTVTIEQGSVVNSATVSGDNFPAVTVQSQPVSLNEVDLKITKQVSETAVVVGKQFQYKLLVGNFSETKATEVEISDFLPAGVRFIDAVAETGTTSYNAGLRLLTWSVPELEPSATALLEINVLAELSDSISNTATITSLEKDVNELDNSSTVVHEQSEFDVPNVFTPNGDGINDMWVMKGLEQTPGTKSLVVFNRWGIEVYKTDNYNNDWTGDGLNEGTYFYQLNIVENGGQKQLKGYVTILR